MKQKFILLCFIMICFYGKSIGQVISGVVSDETGTPLPGVSVTIKGTTKGTSTNEDGVFNIDVLKGSILSFSYIGYLTQEFKVGSGSKVNISLVSNKTLLEEVVVTALGITKEQKTLGYATQLVDSKNIAAARELNVANSLIGRVAGLDITKSSSGLGSSTRVVLRGDRSVTGNNQALIVVDGVPMNNLSILGPNLTNQNIGVSNAQGGKEYSDAFSSINPDDIESINVLRGASATALYGSRAANGALIITTRKGIARKGIGVSVNSSFQFERINELREFQNEYGQGAISRTTNIPVYNPLSEGSWGPRFGTLSTVPAWGPSPAAAAPATLAYEAQPNNIGDFFSTGNQVSNSIALSGGSERGQSYFSYTNVNAKGVVSSNELKRHIANLRLTSKFGSKLNLDSKITYLFEDIDNRPQTGERLENPLRNLYRMPRSISTSQVENYQFIDPVTGRNRQNFWNPGSNGGQNPYWVLNNITQQDLRSRLTGFAAATYKLNDALSFMARGGLDAYWDNVEGKVYSDTYILAPNGDYNILNRNSREMNLDFIAFYVKNLNSNLKIDASGGYSFVRTLFDQLFVNSGNAVTGGLNLENVFTTTNFRAPAAPVQTPFTVEKQGLFLASDFIYKDAITLSLTGRNDWSSTLPKDNWSYFFPSAGVSFLVSSLYDLPQKVSFLKVRTSLAQTGNDTYPYAINPTYTIQAGGPGGYLQRDNNKIGGVFKPERTTSFELGVESKFMKNRFGFDLTYYNNVTKDQIFQIPVSITSGYNNLFTNGGSVRNSGIEAIINLNVLKTKDFNWNVNVNYARNYNKLLSLSDNLVKGVDSKGDSIQFVNISTDFMNNTRAVVGKPLGELYSRGFERDLATGAVKIGTDGLPIVTAAQSVYLGNTRARWTGGISNRLTYKAYTLSFLISARVGGVVSSYTNAILSGDGVLEGTLEGRETGLVIPGILADGSQNTKSVSAESYWLKVGNRNATIGEPFVYSATNVRLRELNLSYALPNDLLKKTPFQSASVSVVGRNLFFLLNRAEGFDPESVVGVTNGTVGMESFSAPSTRQFGFNLNLSF
ncbi:MAG: SusC/RagA family TonB-linked outer membrane protein [Leadbetterella sp.]